MNKYKFLGSILHIVYRILSFMTRKEYFYADGVKINEPNIIVFWHRKIFTVCNATRIIKKKASIVSASKDGEILAEVLKREGNELIRGSSNRDNIKSLKEAVRYAKKNYTLGIAIDGPSGPIFEPKAGAVFIAQKTGMPIVPVSSYCSKKWIFKNMWDKLEIPKPFSKCVHYVAEPFYLTKETTLEESIKLVKEKIHQAGNKAFEIYNEKYNKNKNVEFNEESFKNYLNKIFEFITTREKRNVSKEKFDKVFNDLYYKKVEERIQKLKEMEIYGEIDLFIKFSTDYNSIDEIFEKYKKYYNKILNKKFKCIEVIGHGDPCFSNTLYDKSSEMLKLIDPKGALTEDEIYTNEYYDLAKLSHSILGNYDFMNNGLFTIELNNDLKMDLKIESSNLESLQDMFIKKVEEYGYDVEVIRVCETSLFLSMLPLHVDIPSKVFAFILNAIDMMKELDKYGK